jgi:hypothetical protein
MRLRRAALHALPLLVACSCGDSGPTPEPSPTPCAVPTSPYATSVVEWWIPSASLAGNLYNDAQQALGAPNVAGYGPNAYTGFVSLGFGGHVTVDLGGCVSDQPGNDIRVYQAVSGEPVTVYVAQDANGPYTQLAPFLADCPSNPANRLPDRKNAGYCDFDLSSAGVSKARYVRVEDGELYPAYLGDTTSEGADLDAVQSLSVPVADSGPTILEP